MTHSILALIGILTIFPTMWAARRMGAEHADFFGCALAVGLSFLSKQLMTTYLDSPALLLLAGHVSITLLVFARIISLNLPKSLGLTLLTISFQVLAEILLGLLMILFGM